MLQSASESRMNVISATYDNYSNHGTFFYDQLAALQLLVDDKAGAQSTIEEYFNGIYLGQIAASGDQVGRKPLV